MGNHHDHDHSNEQKPVSFTVPFILAVVTLTVILSLVSLGNPCHDCVCDKDCSKECMEACEKGDHSKHPESVDKEGNVNQEKAAPESVETPEAVHATDTAAVKETEAHH